MKTFIFLFALVMSSHAMAKKNQLVCCKVRGGYSITESSACKDPLNNVKSYSSVCPLPFS
jgi:hypothetical protein